MSVLGQVADRISGGRLTKRDFDQRLRRYLSNERRSAGDGEVLTDAFLKSGGVWLTEASRQIAEGRPHYDFSQAEDVLGLWREPGSMDRALAQLDEHGYAILDTRLPDSTVQELREYFAQAPCTLTSDKATSLAPGETVRVDMTAPLAEKYSLVTGEVLQSATVRQLLLDRGLLEIAQAYVRSAPIIDIVTAWYSFPSDKPSHQAAQLFHFDLDRVRWLKVFLLLTDQTAETGAHVYIPGTQRDRGIDANLLARGYARLEDDEVDRYHPRSTWKVMEAPSGAILLEDTRGLHKGINVVKDHRLMLQFEYTQSLFGHEPDLAKIPLAPIEDPYWSRMRAAYPELFRALDR